MSWPETYIRDLRSRLAEAKQQGLFLSAMDVAFFRELVTWWTRASMQGWARPNDGMLPTIAETRRHGVTHLFVTCERQFCRQTRRLALDDLYMPPGRQKLPEHTVFRDLPNVCRWRCLKCGSRKVSVMAHWPTGLANAYEPENGITPDPTASGQTGPSDEG